MLFFSWLCYVLVAALVVLAAIGGLAPRRPRQLTRWLVIVGVLTVIFAIVGAVLLANRADDRIGATTSYGPGFWLELLAVIAITVAGSLPRRTAP